MNASEFPTSGGSRLIRACGTRFITHKVAALNRIIDRIGAYLSHIIALTEDSSTTPADKPKLKGYVTKWRESKTLIGCAVFHDILKPTTLHLQGDQLCTISAIEAILKSTNTIEKLKTMPMKDFPSINMLRAKDHEEESNHKTYQGVDLTYFDRGLTFLQNHFSELLYSLLHV